VEKKEIRQNNIAEVEQKKHSEELRLMRKRT
jgi:hypothetical protein